MAGGGPIDAHRGIDGGLDVFGIDVTILGPAVIRRVRAGRVGPADNAAALDAAAGEESELLRMVVAALLRRKRTDGAAEFAHHHHHGVGEQPRPLQVVQ